MRGRGVQVRYAVIGLLPAEQRDAALRRGVGALPLRARTEVWAREAIVDSGGALLAVLVRLGILQAPLLLLIRFVAAVVDVAVAAAVAAAGLVGLGPAGGGRDI